MNIIDERKINNLSTINKGDTFIYKNDLYICFKHSFDDGLPTLHCVNLRNGETNKIWGGDVELVDVECHIIGNKHQPIFCGAKMESD